MSIKLSLGLKIETSFLPLVPAVPVKEEELSVSTPNSFGSNSNSSPYQRKLSQYYTDVQSPSASPATPSGRLSDRFISVDSPSAKRTPCAEEDREKLYDKVFSNFNQTRLVPIGRSNVYKVVSSSPNSCGLTGDPIAIFKPGGRRELHEKALGSTHSKDGIPKESEAINETIVAGLENLLPTLYAKMPDGQHGILQTFVPGSRNLDDLTPEEMKPIIANLPVQKFQKIAIIDLKYSNTDRNRSNLLVSDKQEGDICPIDHALILPKKFSSPGVFCWLDWKQAHCPFTQESKEEIQNLDFDKDAAEILAKFPGYPIECIETMDFCYHLLKTGVEKGLTPYQLAQFLIGKPLNFLCCLYRTTVEEDPEIRNTFIKKQIDLAIDKVADMARESGERVSEEAIQQAIFSLLD